ncbi:hypothetical protein Slala03_58280 [Streptomyces lavendulae subsp. lavendulae]|nr:hypothetical protein Slala03_58280 [Streptomyces lavendulae subsp. lavendulae]GLX35112.1 hypothetical protein Sros01_11850 [Streptomyces roseochromogenus]
MNERAPRTASNRAGRAQDADPETAVGSTGGSPCRNGSSTVDPFVPMRGTPGIRGRRGGFVRRELRGGSGAGAKSTQVRGTIVPNAEAGCKGRCTCTRRTCPLP